MGRVNRFAAVLRARSARCWQTDPLDLVEPPLRLWLVPTSTAVADSILRIADRGDAGARAVGATDDVPEVGFAWSGRRQGEVGGAGARSEFQVRGLRQRAASKDRQVRGRVNRFAAVLRARSARCWQTDPLDLVEPPLRLWLVPTSTAVADSILRIADRGDAGARAVGATDDVPEVGFAWSGRRQGEVGGAGARSEFQVRGLRQRAASKDRQVRGRVNRFAAVLRARSARCWQTDPLDLVEPPLRLWLVPTSTAVADSILRIADRGDVRNE